MKKNRDKLFLIIIAVITTCFIASGSLAWFSRYDTVNDMKFKILQIDSEVRMYFAVDGNNNGVPDLLSTENYNKYYNDYAEYNDVGEVINDSYQTYVNYTNQYYEEKYDFILKESKIALSADSVANQFTPVSLTEVAPSKIYTLKFEVTNYVGAENTLSFGFSSVYSGNLAKLSNFECRIGILETTDGQNVSYEFTEWEKLTDGTSYGGLTVIDGIVIDGTNEYTGLSGRKDLWLQIKMSNGAENTNLENFDLPDFQITFMFDYEKV